MEHSEYFRDKAKTLHNHPPERTPNTGADAATTIIIYATAYPHTPQDHRHAPAPWTQGRHEAWQDRIDEYKTNPTNETEPAIGEHAPHTQNDFDDLIEQWCRLAINKTLIENELERRRNDNDRR